MSGYKPQQSSGCDRKNSILVGSWQGRSGIISEDTDELKCLVEKVQWVLCDTWRPAVACCLPWLSSVVLVLCGFLQNWAKSCPCLFLLPACAQGCHCSSHPCKKDHCPLKPEE